jgi:anti-anti-sigma factor
MAIDDPLTITRHPGIAPGTSILTLVGPVTLSNLFDLQARLRDGFAPVVQLLDLSGVPYMDSAGMGAIINFHVSCQNKRIRLIVCGVSPRVMELFRMTRVDSVLSFFPSVEAAEAAL